MRNFKSILFVADHRTPFDSGLSRAVDVAERSGAQLTLVDVVRDGNEVADVILEDRQMALEALLPPIRARGIEVDSRLLLGDPAGEVDREVERQGHDLIMKCWEGGTGERWPYSGADFELMRNSRAPLWIIKPSVRTRPLKVLAALDAGGGDTDGELGMDRLILDLAASVRAICDGEIHIVHAWSLGREILREVGRGVSPGGVSGSLENRARISVQRAVQGVLPAITADAVGAHIQLCEGEPVEVISEVAQREEIDLIVMGTVARTGLAGLVVGNTAEKVLARADCSLLTIKPKHSSSTEHRELAARAEIPSSKDEQAARE